MYSYDEFRIEIRRGEQGVFGDRVTVDSTNPRHGRLPMIDADPTTDSVNRVLRQGTAEERVWLGDELGRCLFPPRVLEAFAETIAELDEDHGVRVRLVCHDTEMARWPWELARVDVPGQDLPRYLFRHARLSLMREVISAEPVAEPRYRRHLIIAPLDATRVQSWATLMPDFPEEVTDTREIRRLSVLRPTPASIEKIAADIRAGGEPLDIFHFTGHGSAPHDGRAGAIILYRGEGESAPLEYPGDELARHLGQAGTSLAFINVCHSDTSSATDGGLGIAESLTSIVPVVITIRDAIADEMAQKFAGVFYRYLLDGSTVDEAVARGRSALDESLPEWSRVVLYSRAHRGRFLEPAPQAPESEGVTVGPPVAAGVHRWSMLAGARAYWLLVPSDSGPELRPVDPGSAVDVAHLHGITASLAVSADAQVAAQLNGLELALAWVDRMLPRLDRWPKTFQLQLDEQEVRLLAVAVDYGNQVRCVLSTDRATYQVNAAPGIEPAISPLSDAPTRCAAILPNATLTVDMDGQLRGRGLIQRSLGIAEIRSLDAARAHGVSLTAVAGRDETGTPVVAAAWSTGRRAVWGDAPVGEVVVVRALQRAPMTGEMLVAGNREAVQLRMEDAP